MNAPQITVEFYGIPRHRAGRPELVVRAHDVAALLRAVQAACPQLRDLCDAGGLLAGHYLLSLDGKRFLGDVGTKLTDGAHVLLLSADPGG